MTVEVEQITNLLRTMTSKDSVTPSGLQVDFDKNITPLYDCIIDCQWEEAMKACKSNPVEAKTWVVRYHEKQDDDDEDDDEEQDIGWRFLPIHSACARQPPVELLETLIEAYPDCARCIDDQGMYPLHYACGNQASPEIIRLLLKHNEKAAQKRDPQGMLPIHYLTCWGPSAVSVIDMVLVAYPDVADAKDDEGNTPMELALDGEYDERAAVIQALQRWFGTANKSSGASTGGASTTSEQPQGDENAIAKENPGMDRSYFEEKKEAEGKGEPQIIHIATPTNYSHIPISASDHASFMPPRLVDTLQQEVSELKESAEKAKADFARQLEEKEASMKEERTSFESEIKELKDEREQDAKKINEIEADLKERDTEIEKMKEELEKARSERVGLSQTLADLTDQHDRAQKKNAMMSDRLGSLNASLNSMMEQQNVVLDAMKAREEHWDSVSAQRQKKIQEMLEIETAKQQQTQDQPSLKACLTKQTREMEAITAVIAAARE